MILSFNIADIIRVPFGYLLEVLYNLTSNYGVALVLFSVVIKLVLLPVGIKSKKSSMKMSRLSPKMKELEAKYAGDQTKYQMAVQQMYKDEGVSMTGGCLWSFIPLLILLPLYTVIRQPLNYLMHIPADLGQQIVAFMRESAPSLFTANTYYDQLIVARHLGDFSEALKEAIPALQSINLAPMSFDFVGIDLGAVPQFAFWNWANYDWANIGLFLLPVISALVQVAAMLIGQKMNNTVATDKDGVQDKEAVKKANSTNMVMILMMPLMSLWIGFTVPAALSVYWTVQGVLGVVQDAILTVHYRKVYDEEDRVKAAAYAAKMEAEEAKERLRAQRRAENPDGITMNTSKKKLQQQQKEASANAAREYAAKQAEKQGVAPEESTVLSGDPNRPYARGRAYKPERYGRNTMELSQNHAADAESTEE